MRSLPDCFSLFYPERILGLFPGIEIYSTSQSHTYDCLVQFQAKADQDRLNYKATNEHPLGLSPYVVGGSSDYVTRLLTLEFKNNLDGLIENVGNSDNRKSYKHIDICVCWSKIASSFRGFNIEEITEASLDQRQFPGVTHLLRKDGDTHIVQVIMLETIIKMITAGRIVL